MKFISLGFRDEANWAEISESNRKSFMKQCLAYDDELRRGGRVLGGETLQPARSAASVRCRIGQIVVTDGPFAETKEHVGGILLQEAQDRNHTIHMMSKHPGVALETSRSAQPMKRSMP
jgi:hypothetical protein